MAILVTNFEQPQWGERKACVAQLEDIGRVTRRKVKLIRPPSGSSLEVPGAIRSTPWKASRDSPLSTTASPEAKRKERVGPPRLVAPIRNSALSPSESDTTGAAKSSSSRS